MPTNARQFNGELRRFVEVTVPEEVARFARRIALDALRRIVFRTPVDDGPARGGWMVSIGSPATGPGIADPGGGSTVQRGSILIAGAPPFQTIHITNNQDHILILEEGGFVPPDPGPSKDPREGRKGRILVSGGYSVQAPRGMAAITVEEIRQAFP